MSSLLLLLGLTVLVFLLLRVLPGDPAVAILAATQGEIMGIDQEALEELRRELGTDQPYHVQYYTWIKDALRGDFGTSLVWNRPVSGEILRRLGLTVQITVLGLALTTLVGFVSGMVAARRQGTVLDYGIRLFVITGMALPTFLSATLVILILVTFFHWFPPIGYYSLWTSPLQALQQMIWPAAAIGLFFAAVLSRLVRNTMLEVLREDYIRTARAKGLSERIVVVRHALRNAMAPNLTLTALLAISMLSGSIIVENIFNIGGLGQGLVLALGGRDYPYVQAVVLLYGVFVIIINLAVDLMYGVLDPRVRLR
jgi:peptide/nickel transport system permease protein